MGYCMSLQNFQFTIKAKNKAEALKAIQALDPNKNGSGATGMTSGGGKDTVHHFAWVTTEVYQKATTLEAAMEAWRWAPYHDKTNCKDKDIISIGFEGEKSGNDMILFNAIAPYVEPGSYLEMYGEDGAVWRWVFDGRTCREITAEMDYEGRIDAFKAILEHKEILPTLIGIHPVLDMAISKVVTQKGKKK